MYFCRDKVRKNLSDCDLNKNAKAVVQSYFSPKAISIFL